MSGHDRPSGVLPSEDSAFDEELPRIPVSRDRATGLASDASLDRVTGQLPGQADVTEAAVTSTLDELLLALIAMRDVDTHGTALMADIEHLFGVQPSPGTVYPRLHDLDDAGLLERHDLVQTKSYRIADETDAAHRIQDAALEHLRLGAFLAAAIESPTE